MTAPKINIKVQTTIEHADTGDLVIVYFDEFRRIIKSHITVNFVTGQYVIEFEVRTCEHIIEDNGSEIHEAVAVEEVFNCLDDAINYAIQSVIDDVQKFVQDKFFKE